MRRVKLLRTRKTNKHTKMTATANFFGRRLPYNIYHRPNMYGIVIQPPSSQKAQYYLEAFWEELDMDNHYQHLHVLLGGPIEVLTQKTKNRYESLRCYYSKNHLKSGVIKRNDLATALIKKLGFTWNHPYPIFGNLVLLGPHDTGGEDTGLKVPQISYIAEMIQDIANPIKYGENIVYEDLVDWDECYAEHSSERDYFDSENESNMYGIVIQAQSSKKTQYYLETFSEELDMDNHYQHLHVLLGGPIEVLTQKTKNRYESLRCYYSKNHLKSGVIKRNDLATALIKKLGFTWNHPYPIFGNLVLLGPHDTGGEDTGLKVTQISYIAEMIQDIANPIKYGENIVYEDLVDWDECYVEHSSERDYFDSEDD